ncbi:TetR/AcrR family transcriptional regulator [Corynebacterium breve]|uniref:TetR/AcrR family transcriptional regulator n=1 Tax=Corynebacterium breve TaxID=3049799 RepID=A0ABY8VHF9_9CORY|nr:TetR/AcrR family transcriptional regulator [Corynebacterium breve]WIM67654.1 TetR/AcrR family transcriptional regulator [Corynebacterium breve]
MKSTAAHKDGRSTRWEKHRKAKKEQLLTDTVRAIRKYGAGVRMEEIAEVAGTSKAVYYRHFTDRAGLWSGVVARTVNYIYRNLPLEPSPGTPLPQLVTDLADTYLTLVDRDPEIYAFVTTTPDAAIATADSDPVVTLTAQIAERLAQLLEQHGFDDSADITAQAIVGAIWATTDRWIVTGRRKPKEDIISTLNEIFTPYLSQHSQRKT